jgi:hypothetical protein
MTADFFSLLPDIHSNLMSVHDGEQKPNGKTFIQVEFTVKRFPALP